MMARIGVLLVALTVATTARAQSVGDTQTGITAVYSNALHGHLTASGQIYDKGKLTAAHKTLPFGTLIKVTNPTNHKTVVLRVNDRGPFHKDRILDISPAAAVSLGFSPQATNQVSLEVIEVGSGVRTKPPPR